MLALFLLRAKDFIGYCRISSFNESNWGIVVPMVGHVLSYSSAFILGLRSHVCIPLSLREL